MLLTIKLTVYGLLLWISSYICIIFQDKANIKEILIEGNFSKINFARLLIYGIFLILSLVLFLGGLFLLLSAFSILVFEISTIMFNALEPESLEFKDCLNAIVQIVSILGSVITASLAYVFKKNKQ